jgi:nucleotide-binding universal stress UspA family protein
MPTVRSILCPVDFSDQSRHALGWAVALAARFDSRLTVLTAVDPLLAEAAKTRLGLDLVKADVEPALREFVASVAQERASGEAAAIDVRVGEASDVILKAIDRERVDLVVMGTHGIGGFRKVLVGSTTEHVLRRAHVPVFAVPPAEAASASLDTHRVNRVLIATDFSMGAGRAAHWGVQFAEQLGASVVLAHVLTPVLVPDRWHPHVDAVDDERVADARRQLDELAASLPAKVRPETAVSLGRPHDAINALAEKYTADLIVMGLIGSGGRPGERPGSIAYRVVSQGSVPVAVVPPSAE